MFYLIFFNYWRN